jgi:hypothetical protein
LLMGGAALRIPAVIDRLAELGFTGLTGFDLMSFESLRELAARMRVREPADQNMR